MVGERSTPNNKPLIAVFSVLLIIIAALTAGIVVINLNSEPENPNLAASCMTLEANEAIVECLSNKSYSFYNENDCEHALKVYDDVPETGDPNLLARIYTYAISTSMTCNDKTAEAKWNQKLSDIILKVEGVYFYD